MSQPSDSFFVAAGPVPVDSPSYLQRKADQTLYESLNHGELCYVCAAPLTGKTSLLIRTAKLLRSSGYAVATLDLAALDVDPTPEQWLYGMLSRIGAQLRMEERLEECWADKRQLGTVQRFFAVLREAALPELRDAEGRRLNLVLFLDELERAQRLKFSADEFFAAVRECHGGRSEDPAMRPLRFCLLGAVSPERLAESTGTPPFATGRRVVLNDFSKQECQPLLKGFDNLGLPGEKGRQAKFYSNALDRVYHWTQGHPYLTQQLCRALAEQWRRSTRQDRPLDFSSEDAKAHVDRLCRALFVDDGVRDRREQELGVRRLIPECEADRAKTLNRYHAIRKGRDVREDESDSILGVLRLSGLVRNEKGRLKVRNRVFELLFDAHWVRRHLPEEELCRQRRALRRNVLAAAAAAVLLLTCFYGYQYIRIERENISLPHEMADGKIFTVEKVSYGHNHVFRRFDFTFPILIPQVSQVSASTEAKGLALFCTLFDPAEDAYFAAQTPGDPEHSIHWAVITDQHGHFYMGEGPGNTAFQDGFSVDHFTFNTFPRRQESFLTGFYNRDGKQLAHLRVHPPREALGPFPEWKARPLPSAYQAENVEIILESIELLPHSNSHSNSNWPPVQTYQAHFQFRRNGAATEPFIQEAMAVEDATGNRVESKGAQWTGLSPQEPVWKLEATFRADAAGGDVREELDLRQPLTESVTAKFFIKPPQN